MTPAKTDHQFHPRSQYVREPVLVDGITRAGKFLLGHIVASMSGMEFMQYPPLLEIALYLTRLGKLDLDTARILVQTDIDLNTYNMMIGRGLNGRVHDSSSIHNAADAERFLARAASEDVESLIAAFQEESRLPLYIGHESLCNGRTLFEIYPAIRLISLQRDPLALIWSWYRRGWGRRFGLDPKSMAIGFATRSGPVPWFALNWEPDYYALSEMDRVIKSIETLQALAREEYEALTVEQRARVHFVAYEEILLDPTTVIGGISRYLGRPPLAQMPAILARERVPRAVPPGQRRGLFEQLRREMSPDLAPAVESLMADYDGYWMTLVTKQRNSGS